MTEKISKEKYEELVLELAKKSLTSEKIGLILKKEHKIQARNIEKIGKILKKHNLPNAPDIENLKKLVSILEKHSSLHKNDKSCKRTLTIRAAKLRKLQNIQTSKF